MFNLHFESPKSTDTLITVPFSCLLSRICYLKHFNDVFRRRCPTRSYVTPDSAYENKLMDPMAKQGWHWVEINQMEHMKRERGTTSLQLPPLPSPPSSSYQRSHWENWMWFVCVFLKRGAHKQPWKGPLYSARQQRCASLGRPFVFPCSQKLKRRKKKKKRGLILSMWAGPNDAIRLGARFGWKRLQ